MSLGTRHASHFASWWSFEDRVEHVTSYAALALGLAALAVAVVAYL